MRNISAHKWWLTLTVVLGTMLNSIDTSIVKVSIPRIKGNLEISGVITCRSL
jgi:hypothetical protein